MNPEFHYLPVAAPLLSDEEFQIVVSEYADSLNGVGGAWIGPEPVGTPARPVFFVVTGGTERRILELVGAARGTRGERAGVAPDERSRCVRAGGLVVLVAYPGRNSLPGAMEVLARLQRDGVAGRIIFLDGPCDEVGLERLRVAVTAGETHGSGVVCEDLAPGDLPRAPKLSAAPHVRKPDGRPLDGRRIGLVGAPSDWLVASSPSPETVQEVWGAAVVEVGMGEFGRRVDSSSRVSAEFFAEAHESWASRVSEPTHDDLVSSGAIYVALRSLVDELELDAITVRCFDLVTERGATGCLALSRLADQGIVAGCEGDLPSALAMLWVRGCLGEPSWMANPARVDVTSNTLTLAHCTVPTCMVSSYQLRSHFESGLGAAVQGSIPTGPVTLLRIGGATLDRVWLAEGEITARGTDETMCRTQVEVALCDVGTPGTKRGGSGAGGSAVVADLLERPLGNHIVLVRGWMADQLLTNQTGSEPGDRSG